jgi:hypothetical protein
MTKREDRPVRITIEGDLGHRPHLYQGVTLTFYNARSPEPYRLREEVVVSRYFQSQGLELEPTLRGLWRRLRARWRAERERARRIRARNEAYRLRQEFREAQLNAGFEPPLSTSPFPLPASLHQETTAEIRIDLLEEEVTLLRIAIMGLLEREKGRSAV